MYISTYLTEDKKTVVVWEKSKGGTRKAVQYDAPYEFFIENEESEQEFFSVNGKRLEKIEFDNPFDFYEVRKQLREEGIKLYESDISCELKILSDYYYKQPVDAELNVTVYDIEVDYDPKIGFSRPENPYARISSIALYHKHKNESIVLALRPKTGKWANAKLTDLPEELLKHDCKIELLSSEKELLKRFFEEIEDSDIVSGWNSEFFDDPYIYARTLKVLGKEYTKKMNFPDVDVDVKVDKREKYGDMELVVKPIGRVWVDLMAIVKKFDPMKRDSYTLESIAEEELKDFEKLEFGKSLYELYHEDFDQFIFYNIRDTQILRKLDEKFKYFDLIIEFSHTVANNIHSVLGTVSTSDSAILNYCKHEQEKRIVLPDGPIDVDENGEKFAGAFVLEPQTGLHHWIASVDIKSLYPSSMRSINISPETIIAQFSNNEIDFEKMLERSNDLIEAVFENGESVTKTAREWYDTIREQNWVVSGNGTIFDQNYNGIIPSILTSWFEDRIKFQKKKSEALKKYEETKDEKYKKLADLYDNIQKTKKLQLNSLYGVFGNKYFRFYDERLAMSTTKTGRVVLLHMAKKIAEILDGKYKYPSRSVLYGDTDSVYFNASFGEDSAEFEQVARVSDLVCQKVNESFPEFMKTTFGCSGGREKYIQAEKEVISDRGIFVAKKHYILHLVQKDGEPVDKMKVMGLQIKKTNIPKQIRKALTKFFERYLKGESWSSIKKDIVAFKQELKEGDLLNIGIPSGVSNVEELTQIYREDPNANIYHMAKASIFYNECLNVFNDKESYKIRSGDKVKKYYFYTAKKYGSFNAIAVPVDMTSLPKWFKEFEPYIDRERQIKSLVDNPIKNILDVLGEAVPSEMNVLAEQLIVF